MNNIHRPRPLRGLGFTLIELLIVVAIIAILAAIAVPNFLEAQTRSKVGRAKSDIRSLVTAVEAYMLDHGKYPGSPMFNANGMELTGSWGVFGRASDGKITQILTTPIAYVTAMPTDPFMEQKELYAHNYTFINWKHMYNDYNGAWAASKGVDNVKFTAEFWEFNSMGPDCLWNGLSATLTYDPTNGTVSIGDIQYYGPGKGFTGLSDWPVTYN